MVVLARVWNTGHMKGPVATACTLRNSRVSVRLLVPMSGAVGSASGFSFGGRVGVMGTIITSCVNRPVELRSTYGRLGRCVVRHELRPVAMNCGIAGGASVLDPRGARVSMCIKVDPGVLWIALWGDFTLDEPFCVGEKL